MNGFTRKIDRLGRIVLPINFRKTLHLKEESAVILTLEENKICIRSCELTCKLCGRQLPMESKFSICLECITKIKKL